jgi:hypothetical protein
MDISLVRVLGKHDQWLRKLCVCSQGGLWFMILNCWHDVAASGSSGGVGFDWLVGMQVV